MNSINHYGKMAYGLSKASGDVFLMGGGAGNVGDEAILTGMLQDVSSSIDSITLVSHDAEHTVERQPFPPDIPVRPVEPEVSKLVGSLLTHDSFVISGGGHFSRYMGNYTKILPMYMIIARFLQKPVYWSAIGVYPSTPDYVMYPLVATLKVSTSVTVRDPISKSSLESYGMRDVNLVPDAATQITPDKSAGKELLARAGLDGSSPTIGIAARRVLSADINQRLYDSYEEVAQYYNKKGWKVVYIPFSSHPYKKVEQDKDVCMSLAEKTPGTAVLNYDKPTELLGAINYLDAMVTTRLHSMIFSNMVDTPFAAIEYAAKCTSLLEHYEKKENGIQLEEVTADKIISILERQITQ